DAAQDDSTVVTPVDDSTSEDTAADGSDRSDLARTGVSLGSLLATLSLVTLAGAGALALRHRLSPRGPAHRGPDRAFHVLRTRHLRPLRPRLVHRGDRRRLPRGRRR